MTYPLESISPAGFQQLAAAIAVRVIGAGVQTFGPGPDGGRDFTFHGVIVWSGDDHRGEAWDGYTVFQVKQRATLTGRGTEDAAWLLRQIKDELDDWADPGRRNPLPDHLVFVSNVALTAVQGTGGCDTVNRGIKAHIANYDDDRRKRMKRLRWRLWDRNQINTYLEAYPEVRRSFPGLLTPYDVWGSLGQLTDQLPLEQLEPALRAHARAGLMDDRYVYFEEAGADPTAKTLLADIAIDLPVASAQSGERTSALELVLDRGERVLRHNKPLRPDKRHLILAGAPGNGKSTLGRFLTQAYRVALHDRDNLVGDHAAVAEGTVAALGRNGLPLPSNRRWPMRIDLAAYSERYGQVEESTLLKWIAEKVSATTDHGRVTAATLHSWLRQWPWILILDGLDEVTAVDPRRRLIQEVESFVAEADTVGADLLIVLTTRPTGFTETIGPDHFERYDLARLSLKQAEAYGDLVADVRLRDRTERLQTVKSRMHSALADDTYAHLMQTPLQVLIMSIILEGSGSLPPDRYQLFDGYYQTVYRRETAKNTPLAKRLQDLGPQVARIHEQVGFELHVRSELADGAMALMSHDELRSIVDAELARHGYEINGADAAVCTDLMDAATRRLVLLVPRGDEGLGFEIRSLQELMAARQLTAGTDKAVLERLRVAAPSPHWRNPWIFAAGHIFATRQDHQREALVELTRKLDEGLPQRLGQVCGVGPRLALELVDDGLARTYPYLDEQLLRTGLRLLSEPPALDPFGVAGALSRVAERSPRHHKVIANAFRDALGSPHAATTLDLQSVLESAGVEIGESGRAMELRHVKRARPSAPDGPSAAWDAESLLDADVLDLVDNPGSRAVLEPAVDELRRAVVDPNPWSESLPQFTAALDRADVAEALELLLEGLTPAEWPLIRAVRDGVLPDIWRRPVGDQLG